jgi:hypothetical protein
VPETHTLAGEMMTENKTNMAGQIVEAILFVAGFACMFFAMRGFLHAPDAGAQCERELWTSLVWLAGGLGSFLVVSHIGRKRKMTAIGIGSPIAEAPSHTTGRTDRVSGDSAVSDKQLSK